MGDLLCDPRLLASPRAASAAVSIAFWDELGDWSSDKRLRVGVETHKYICEHYSLIGWPDAPLSTPAGIPQRECSRILNTLLSRVVVGEAPCREAELVPLYAGNPEEKAALVADLQRLVGASVFGIAASSSSWNADVAMVSCIPPPPAEMPLCHRPGEVLPVEEGEALRAFYSRKKLHIVGGQSDAKLIAVLAEAYGFAEIDWIPCERHKKPRGLGKRWAMLDCDRDIVLCITGRVGHSTSNEAKIAADQRSAPYLEAYQANNIADALADFRSRAADETG